MHVVSFSYGLKCPFTMYVPISENDLKVLVHSERLLLTVHSIWILVNGRCIVMNRLYDCNYSRRGILSWHFVQGLCVFVIIFCFRVLTRLTPLTKLSLSDFGNGHCIAINKVDDPAIKWIRS